METNMICPRCREPLDEGAVYCGNCGQKVADNNPSPQVLQPQIIHPNQPVPPTTVAPQPAAVPAYALAVAANSGEKKSIIALIIGVIGIPASFIPLAGMALGIGGLVLGTTARVKYKHTLNLLAIIFSSFAIVVSLALWVWSIDHNQKAKVASFDSSNSQPGGFVSVSTPCFKVQINSGLTNYKPKGCNFNSASSTEEYAVVAITNSKINQTNITKAGEIALQAGATSTAGKISGGHLGTFAGSMAYIANYASTKIATRGLFAFVLHKTTDGENIFIIGRAVIKGNVTSFGSLESSWQWK